MTVRPTLVAWRDRYPRHPANGTVLPTWLAEGRSAGQPHASSPRAVLPPVRSSRVSRRLRARRFSHRILRVPARCTSTPRRSSSSIRSSSDWKPRTRRRSVRARISSSGRSQRRRESARRRGSATRSPGVRVDTLSDREQAPPGGFLYQFALAPEEEAEQMATRALSDGHLKALALVSADDLGRRLLESFTLRSNVEAATCSRREAYDPAANDHQPEIKRLLRSMSRRRERALASTLGEKFEFEARPRQDAGSSCSWGAGGAGAPAATGASISFADDLPIYATSSIYEPLRKPTRISTASCSPTCRGWSRRPRRSAATRRGRARRRMSGNDAGVCTRSVTTRIGSYRCFTAATASVHSRRRHRSADGGVGRPRASRAELRARPQRRRAGDGDSVATTAPGRPTRRDLEQPDGQPSGRDAEMRAGEF